MMGLLAKKSSHEQLTRLLLVCGRDMGTPSSLQNQGLRPPESPPAALVPGHAHLAQRRPLRGELQAWHARGRGGRNTETLVNWKTSGDGSFCDSHCAVLISPASMSSPRLTDHPTRQFSSNYGLLALIVSQSECRFLIFLPWSRCSDTRILLSSRAALVCPDGSTCSWLTLVLVLG